MFFKTQFAVPPVEVEDVKGPLFKSYGPLVYYALKQMPVELQEFNDTLKPTSWKWVEITNSPAVRPHRDHGIKAALNFYVRSGRALTSFYTPLGEGYKFDGEHLSNLYHWNQVEKVSSFQAEDGDAYLLDVSQIHSVHKLVGSRLFIQANWVDRTFEELLHIVTK